MENDVIKFPLVRPLPHSSFDPDALKVFRRLREAHYKTYFVGGCIRDLLLGRTPKDFDIATAASPQQICKLFRNGRIIGRRFLIVTIFLGPKSIEVTTFRRSPWEQAGVTQNPNLLLNSDNVFGTDEQDARRRDFTINALFYDVMERTVIDYVDGISDLEAGLIRMIGDPELRFSEDPVRIIRALKLQATLNFDIVPETSEAIYKCVPKLRQASIARLLLEMQKILKGGASYACFDRLSEASIFSIIAPDLHRLWYQNSSANQLLKKMLSGLDSFTQPQRNQFSEALFLSAVCFPLILANKSPFKNGDLMMDVSKQKIVRFIQNFNIPRRMTEHILEIIRTSIYLARTPVPGGRNKKFPRTSLFNEALTCLQLQADGDPKKWEAYMAWNNFRSQERMSRKVYV